MGLYLGNMVQALVKEMILPVVGLARPGLGETASYKTAMLS
jgi:hypothetical protein